MRLIHACVPAIRPPFTRRAAAAPFCALLAAASLAACGAPATTAAPARGGAPSSAIVDPAALYCQGTGGTVIHRSVGGRRADLCRLPDGRTVSAADLLNSHNDL